MGVIKNDYFMEKFINIKEIVRYIKKRKVSNWLDKLTFPRIFLLWILIIVSFGLIYYFLQSSSSYLLHPSEESTVSEMKDTIYFSFITATSTGFENIIPFGKLKWVAIFEVITGLLLLAVVTSKLVSIKQDIILNELYESSISERINRLRSSLLLFRQNMHRLISKIEERTIKKREIENIYIHLSSLEDIISEVLNLVNKPNDQRFSKGLGPVNTGLIFNSILSSFETVNELIIVLDRHGQNWKSDINLKFTEQCLVANDKLFEKLDLSKDLMKQTINDLTEHKNEITKIVKDQIINEQLNAKA